jgi:hypothetical protein
MAQRRQVQRSQGIVNLGLHVSGRDGQVLQPKGNFPLYLIEDSLTLRVLKNKSDTLTERLGTLPYWIMTVNFDLPADGSAAKVRHQSIQTPQ